MRLAIVGAGVSGLVAAYLLHKSHEVVVFEGNSYPGGHTNTIEVAVAGRVYPVDTGFIVFNERNYPNFVRLLQKLGVGWQPANMSFSFRCQATGLEYGFRTPASLLAEWRNLTRPDFYRLLRDIWRFRRELPRISQQVDEELTLGDYLRQQRYSAAFSRFFLVPFGAAIWSAAPGRLEAFPVAYLARFFANHGLLNLRDKPRWQVIRGGSCQYVKRLVEPWQQNLRLGAPIAGLRRHSAGVEIYSAQGPTENFDAVILAVHSDQALRLLVDASPQEREILGAIPYQENFTVLHTDASWLPRHRAVWASWNYLLPRQDTGRVAVTYHQNRLQSLRAPVAFCVTLNPPQQVQPRTIIREITYHHPVYTAAGFAAQKRWAEINGVHRTYFCGAYWGSGFHEDGVNSALTVGRLLGVGL